MGGGKLEIKSTPTNQDEGAPIMFANHFGRDKRRHDLAFKNKFCKNKMYDLYLGSYDDNAQGLSYVTTWRQLSKWYVKNREENGDDIGREFPCAYELWGNSLVQ